MREGTANTLNSTISIEPTNPLRVLLAIDEAGSLARAAQQLKITQPGVSKALARLEQQYGVALVDRSQLGARFTPIGQQLLGHARLLNATLKRAADTVRQSRGQRDGVVSVALSHAAIARFLPRILPRFRRHWPSVELRVSTAIFPAVVTQVLTGIVDVAVLPLPQRDLPDGLEATPLGPSRLRVIARTGHPLATRRKLEDLARADWVLPGADTSTTHLLVSSFEARGLGPPICRAYAQTLSALQVMMASTNALKLVPAEAGTRDKLLSGSLVVLPIKNMPDGPVLYRLQRNPNELSPAALALSNLLDMRCG